MNGTERDGAIRSWLADRVDQGRMPGAVWWVEDADGAVSRGAVGCAAVEPDREPARLETVYDLASLTKPLSTATLAVLLEQDGGLDLGRPCAALLPEFRGGPYARATYVDLASHRSGMPAWTPLHVRARDRESALRAIAAQPPGCERGTTLYSDLGYVALGVALERATGRDLAALFRERICAPLGLRETGYGVDPGRTASVAPTERGNAYERALAGDRAAGYRFRDRIIRGVVHDGNAHALGGVAGHAGLFGTAAEVARIARAWLEEGALGLAPGARRRILRAEPAGADRTLGLVLARASGAARGVLPDDAPGHVGFTGTSVWVVPERGQVAVLLTNRVHPEVGTADFQDVRRGFHRVALGDPGDRPGPALAD